MNKEQQKGFTIIEVVLVLAIAGLIFLMVFVALPALQRGQRDTQRRNDISRFRAQINQYQANNRGNLPSNAEVADQNNTGFRARYLDDSGGWNDPLGGQRYAYRTYNGSVSGTVGDTPGAWTYATGMRCEGENFTGTGALRTYAVAMKLEGAGTTCQDNQ